MDRLYKPNSLLGSKHFSQTDKTFGNHYKKDGIAVNADKIGLEAWTNWTFVVSSGEPEVIWNAFRFASLILNEMDDVFMFLQGPAVSYEDHDSEKFPLKELAKTFALSEGELRA